jgi:hypothetical protein
MPKGPQGQKRPADTIANAIRVAKILTGEIEEDMGDSGKDKAAQALGRKGGAARRDKLLQSGEPRSRGRQRRSGGISVRNARFSVSFRSRWGQRSNHSIVRAAPHKNETVSPAPRPCSRTYLDVGDHSCQHARTFRLKI